MTVSLSVENIITISLISLLAVAAVKFGSRALNIDVSSFV